MDETPIFFDMPHNCTVTMRGAKEVRIRGTKGGKQWITYVVTCSGSGQMLKPKVIFRGKTSRVLKTVKPRDSEICVTVQPKAWMDQDMMRKWIKYVLLPYTKGRHCLVLMDSFRAHVTDDIVRAMTKAKATVVVIPGGCTSKIQPVDVCLNKPIKDAVRSMWDDTIVQQVTSGESNAPSITKDHIVDWIVTANHVLNEQSACVIKAFKVCGITSALDGSENGLIRCAKELPQFCIPYGDNEENDEDIFADTDVDEDDEDEEDVEEDENEDYEDL
jgi:hypothetical protein